MIWCFTKFRFIFFISTFALSFKGHSSINIERQGSSLKANWSSSNTGTWQLNTDDGATCAIGAFGVGETSIRFDKIAAPTNFSLTLIPASNGSQESTKTPGIKLISNLPKISHAAIIYQLPVRTYFARKTDAQTIQVGHLRELTVERLREIQQLGADYIWLTGILEHASPRNTDPDVVKGDAGSYYAIYDSWDVAPEIGQLADIERVIRDAHSIGIRILLDLIPNHTARQHRTDVIGKKHLNFGVNDTTARFFDSQNNYFYIGDTMFTPPNSYHPVGSDGQFDQDPEQRGVQVERPARVTGNDVVNSQPDINDWFETAKLNYGYNFQTRQNDFSPRPKTWSQILDVAKYWVEKGIDGFRVDYAHSVPLEFWRFFSQELRSVSPSVFLVAEAYEGDERMRVPGFSYERLLAAGFDSVYNSQQYWHLRKQAEGSSNLDALRFESTPAMRPEVLALDRQTTLYLENHDEVRIASRLFSPPTTSHDQRTKLGFAYSTYAALLPGHFLIHGGQESGEDASVFGPFAGDNGRTSIFDFVYQTFTSAWLVDHSTNHELRNLYQSLLALKKTPAISAPNTNTNKSFLGLGPVNQNKENAKWIASYLRFIDHDVYLVVLNADPRSSHDVTLHFTTRDGHDELGAVAIMSGSDLARRIQFTEILTRPNWSPKDPAISGEGIPVEALLRSSNIPSGLYLGEMLPASVYVFRIARL